jgi:hypothetical protein
MFFMGQAYRSRVPEARSLELNFAAVNSKPVSCEFRLLPPVEKNGGRFASPAVCFPKGLLF